jgi:hypothetical protein
VSKARPCLLTARLTLVNRNIVCGQTVMSTDTFLTVSTLQHHPKPAWVRRPLYFLGIKSTTPVALVGIPVAVLVTRYKHDSAILPCGRPVSPDGILSAYVPPPSSGDLSSRPFSSGELGNAKPSSRFGMLVALRLCDGGTNR